MNTRCVIPKAAQQLLNCCGCFWNGIVFNKLKTPGFQRSLCAV
jgi:hypothetical protein